MRSPTYCKRLFTVGALWNWGMAALLLGLAAFSLEGLSWFLNDIPENIMWFHICMGLVAIFGLAYYWVAQDVRRNRDIIKMGVLGKTLVVVLIVPAWYAGQVTTLGAAAATVDFVFTVLFVDVLLNTPA